MLYVYHLRYHNIQSFVSQVFLGHLEDCCRGYPCRIGKLSDLVDFKISSSDLVMNIFLENNNVLEDSKIGLCKFYHKHFAVYIEPSKYFEKKYHF